MMHQNASGERAPPVPTGELELGEERDVGSEWTPPAPVTV